MQMQRGVGHDINRFLQMAYSMTKYIKKKNQLEHHKRRQTARHVRHYLFEVTILRLSQKLLLLTRTPHPGLNHSRLEGTICLSSLGINCEVSNSELSDNWESKCLITIKSSGSRYADTRGQSQQGRTFTDVYFPYETYINNHMLIHKMNYVPYVGIIKKARRRQK